MLFQPWRSFEELVEDQYPVFNLATVGKLEGTFWAFMDNYALRENSAYSNILNEHFEGSGLSNSNECCVDIEYYIES